MYYACFSYSVRFTHFVYPPLSNGLPKYLSMDDQSRFAIGYYHQREDLYKTTTDKEKN